MLIETILVSLLVGSPSRPESDIGSLIDPAQSFAKPKHVKGTTAYSILPSSQTVTDITLRDSINPKSRLSVLKKELELYAGLADGWDGAESKKPSSDHIVFAKKLVDRLPPSVPLPKPMISHSGVVGFYWKNANLIADIEIEDGGVLSFFARSLVSQQEVFVDDITLDCAADEIGIAYASLFHPS